MYYVLQDSCNLEDNRAAFKIVAASLEARSKISSSIEQTEQNRPVSKCQIKDLHVYISQ